MAAESDSQARAAREDAERPSGWLIGAFAVVVLATIAFTTAILQVPKFADQALALLLIGGITTFFLALCLVVLVFKRVGLTNPALPLGLPDGTIRAFIALTLILLFFVIAVFLYLDLARPSTRRLEGVSAEQLASIPGEEIQSAVRRTLPDGSAVFDVERPISTEASQDIARQIVTTVSTLVVAIASFYFGATFVSGETRTGNGQRGRTSSPPAGAEES